MEDQEEDIGKDNSCYFIQILIVGLICLMEILSLLSREGGNIEILLMKQNKTKPIIRFRKKKEEMGKNQRWDVGKGICIGGMKKERIRWRL